MAFWSWSKTPATNASADTTINWAEGQAPSTVNDSARAMMARMAEYRDDISGVIVTGGSVNAYTVTSNQGFDSLAHMNGQMIAFSPHVTNTGGVQINVDGLGFKPYRPSPGVDFLGGELIQGTPYTGLYNNSTGEIYARGFMTSPYAVPYMGGMDYWDSTTPNSAFIFPAGQAISRSVYSRAFASWGTTFGAGNGSTTFNVPDKRGRVTAAADNMGGSLASRLSGGGFGLAQGVESHLLTALEIPGHTHSGTTAVMNSNAVHSHGVTDNFPNAVIKTTPNLGNGFASSSQATSSISAAITINNANIDHTHDFQTNLGNGIGGSALNLVQPTICCNYIIRII